MKQYKSMTAERVDGKKTDIVECPDGFILVLKLADLDSFPNIRKCFRMPLTCR